MTLEIGYRDEQYKLKFQKDSCADFENLDLFNLDIHPGVAIIIYLKDLFICGKNGMVDFKIQLWARCRNADCHIGNIKDTIKL